MKIVSKFNDYYDFVAPAYEGGDPALVLISLGPRKTAIERAESATRATRIAFGLSEIKP